MKMPSVFFVCALAAVVAAGACSKKESNPNAPTTCSPTAGAASTSTFGAEGGNATVSVTAGTGCAWTAASNASFITISQGSAGTGNGTVQFTVAANTGAERTGNITVAGTTIAVVQRAATPTTPVTLSAPVAQSPIQGATVDSARPALVVTNSTATGNAGTVTYRFEVSDQSSFPNEPARTFAVDGVAQGSGTTSGVIPRDLGPSVLWYWHARATNGTVTSAYSATETFRTASTCSFTVSPTSVSAASGGSTTTVTITTADPACAWTATSNASFLTITSAASGTGNGSVTFTAAANTGGTRTGTLTIAGQTVTVTQSGGSGIVAQFRLVDAANQAGATTECQIRSLTSGATTCRLESTSFPLGTTSLVNFAWTVQYTYGTIKNLSQDNSSPTFSFTDTCGGVGSTSDGAQQPLTVTLTVTDSAGNTATVTSGQGGQPALFLRLFTCGI